MQHPILALFAALSAPFSALAQSDIPHFGLAVAASSLGASVQAATGITHSANVRLGFNIFDYNDTFSSDGIHYNGELKLRSVQATWDQFFGLFHISPGLLIYDGNSGNANATVPPGQSFILNGATFYSGSSNPVTGTGALSLNKAAPMILIGFGNLLPRNGRHFGFNVEAGVVFQGSPNVSLNLGGTTCFDSAQHACANTATDPTVQSSMQAEETKLNHDLNPFRFFPVVSIGFGYKF